MVGHTASSVAYDFNFIPSRAHPTIMPSPVALICSLSVLYVDGKNVCVAPESKTASCATVETVVSANPA